MKFDKEARAYYKKHWKLAVHLILRTKRFGMNNEWWGPYPGSMIFGDPLWKVILGVY